MKAVLILLDGLGDTGPKTPLSAARKPNIDSLARAGTLGMLHTIGIGVVPGSDTAHLSLFGYNPETEYIGRGPFEALGAGIPLLEGDIAFRANLATREGNNIADRRAGRIDSGTAADLVASLQKISLTGAELIVKHTVQHRLAIVFRGRGLSSNVSPTDLHVLSHVKTSAPLDKSPASRRTARLLNDFTTQAEGILEKHPLNKKRRQDGFPPANTIICRGAGQYRKTEPINKKYKIKAACVAGGSLYKGVARYVGMTVPDIPGATATYNTDLLSKLSHTIELLRTHDYVFMHIKATDNAGHDGSFSKKRQMIEKVDKMVRLLKTQIEDTYILITGDHSTPVSRKRHTSDPVPFLLCGPDVRPDRNASFHEFTSQNGGLGQIRGREVMPLIADLLDKSVMFGS